MKKYNLKFIVFIIVFLIAIFAFGCKDKTNEGDNHKEDNQQTEHVEMNKNDVLSLLDNVKSESAFTNYFSSYIGFINNRLVIDRIKGLLETIPFEVCDELSYDSLSTKLQASFEVDSNHSISLICHKDNEVLLCYNELEQIEENLYNVKNLCCFKANYDYELLVQLCIYGFNHFFEKPVVTNYLDCDLSNEEQEMIVKAYIIKFATLSKQNIEDHIYKGKIRDYYGKYNDHYAVIVDGAGLGAYQVITRETIDGVTITYRDSNKILLINEFSVMTLEEGFKQGIVNHDDLEEISNICNLSFGYDVYFHSEGSNLVSGLEHQIVLNIDDIEYPIYEKKGYYVKDYNIDYSDILSKVINISVVWEPLRCAVLFDVNGGDYLEFGNLDIAYDEEVILPTATKSGSWFEGWFFNDKLIAGGVWKTDKYESITLKARWSNNLNEYTIGRYPQSHVGDKKLIDELNKITETNSLGYYVYNDEMYCKIMAQPVEENTIYYSDGCVATSKEEWFKVEPIKWTVIEDGSFILLTPSKLIDVAYYDGDSNPYSKSYLQSFLNKDVLTRAFDSSEQYVMRKMSKVNTEYVVTEENGQTKVESYSVGIGSKILEKSILSEGKYDIELTDYSIARGAVMLEVKSSQSTKLYGYWWIIEQVMESPTVFKQAYYDAYKKEFKTTKGDVWGVCINITICIKK